MLLTTVQAMPLCCEDKKTGREQPQHPFPHLHCYPVLIQRKDLADGVGGT
jgi:hypothetical protein